MRPPPALALALALALVVVAPSALAHLARDRPHIQLSEENRRVAPALSGNAATFSLQRTFDPFEDAITQMVDPSKWTVTTEYRAQPSDVSTSFVARWNFTRLVEYRDLNANARFEKSDTIVRSWRFDKYAWNATGPLDVTIGGVAAKDVVWNGTASGAPTLKVEADAAGTVLTDEGARVRSQDVILYLDLSDLPPRGVGDLYVLEGLASATGATLSRDVVDPAVAENATAGIVARAEGRLAELDWGAQATLDKVERNLNLTIDAPGADGASAFRIDFPLFDKTLHMVFVASMEYVKPAPKVTPVGAAPLALALALALALRRRP